MEISPLTCSADELYSVVSSSKTTWLRLCLSNPAITPQHVVILLRNSSVTQEIVQLVCDRQDWLLQNSVQFAVVNCPRTPHILALKMLQLLHWNDLMKSASNVRLSPRLRRAAENHLRDRLPELTLGERMTVARTGPKAIVAFLRNDAETRVVAALLRNPHLIEDDVLRIINDEFTGQEVLASIGSDYKWSQMYPVRLALVRSPRTPLPLALSFISKLRRQDLEPLINSPHTPELVRRAAERILEGDY